VDGSKVYFTTTRQLAGSDLDTGAGGCTHLYNQFAPFSAGCDLYLYDSERPAGDRLVQVSAGEANASHPTVGSGASVLNAITGISGDGSHVYFVAKGVLTTETNGAGDAAVLNQPNLYVWDADTEAVSFVAKLVAADQDTSQRAGNGLWGGQGTWRNRAYPVPVTGENGEGVEVGGAGDVLVFQTKAPLTAADTDGAQLDAYRYRAQSGELECVSCRAGGDGVAFDVNWRGAPSGGAAGTDFAEEGRWVSENGETIVFATRVGLLPGQPDGTHRNYLWRSGELYTIPGPGFVDGDGAGQGQKIAGPFLSHDGSTVSFETYARLLARDTDSAADVYALRVDGGFASDSGEEVEACVGEDCQGAPTAPPDPREPASHNFDGEGNISPAAVPARRCRVALRRARRLDRRARVLRRRAARRGTRVTRRARRLARRADRLQRRGRACRRASRRASR
jgi:hypothetical protein